MTKIYSLALLCLLMLAGVNANAQVSFTAAPADGETVETLRKIVLTFPAGTTADKGSKYADATVVSEDGSQILASIDYGTDANQMEISFAEITTKGNYTVNVPEDAITCDGTAVQAFTLNYTVGIDISKTSTLLPAPGDVKWIDAVVFYNSYIAEQGKSLSTDYNGKATITSPSGVTENLEATYDWQIGAGKYKFCVRKLAIEKG